MEQQQAPPRCMLVGKVVKKKLAISLKFISFMACKAEIDSSKLCWVPQQMRHSCALAVRFAGPRNTFPTHLQPPKNKPQAERRRLGRIVPSICCPRASAHPGSAGSEYMHCLWWTYVGPMLDLFWTCFGPVLVLYLYCLSLTTKLTCLAHRHSLHQQAVHLSPCCAKSTCIEIPPLFCRENMGRSGHTCTGECYALQHKLTSNWSMQMQSPNFNRTQNVSQVAWHLAQWNTHRHTQAAYLSHATRATSTQTSGGFPSKSDDFPVNPGTPPPWGQHQNNSSSATPPVARPWQRGSPPRKPPGVDPSRARRTRHAKGKMLESPAGAAHPANHTSHK